jgi:phosphatidylserine/phosphatidylglycerophosphate/cardiolipin synthase-like enzyme
MIYAAFGLLGMFSSLFSISSTFAAVKVSQVVPAGVYLNSNGSPLIPLIESTKHSLDIEIYTMEDPYVRQLLRDALARSVKIRILHDPNPDGMTCNVFAAPTATTSADCKDQQKLVSDVTSAGGSYTPFDKKTLCPNGGGSDGTYCYEHGKMVISDGSVVLISTGNFDPTNMCLAPENPTQCDRDFTVIESDTTIVSTLESIFQNDLKGVAYDVQSLIPPSLTGVLTVSPVSLQPLLDLIKSAKSSIVVETQYLEEPEINAALVEMAKKPGVKVTVTTSSVCYFDTPSSSDADETKQTYTAFDQAGISTTMFDHLDLINGAAGYLHAKVIIVDGTKAWVGSENGSTGSLTENREYGVIFTDPQWIATLTPVLAADHSSPNNETWQQSLACTKDK